MASTTPTVATPLIPTKRTGNSARITENAMTILNKRYLNNGESVEGMFQRVAGGNANYYQLMEELRFLPNSPTLFNAGLNNGCTLSACFVFNVADTMRGGHDSIVGTRDKAIAVAKAGGGVGYYFGDLRPKGSVIRSVHRVACGPVAVLKDYHAISDLITQGGKRELAQMGVLPCWHDDIYHFIHCKDEDPQGLGSFNISVSWTDEWVNRAFAPGNEGGSERKLWNEQCKSAWKTGCPGMLFHDAINRANPNKETVGVINGTNPCGETPNRSDEPCNLGSLVLCRYFVPATRDLDWGRLYDDAYLATRFLDDILDRNEFPHPAITEAAMRTRKLGLGVMGWADLLGMMHIPYASVEAENLADRVMRCINEAAGKASEDLAKEKGPYKAFSETKTNGPRRRNETVTSIAPTGTIAIIAGVWGSIEPHFGLRCERTTAEGIKMQDGIQDWVWERMEGFIPQTASEVPLEWHIRHQAAFQKHTELGVSKTINLPNSATVEDVSRAYRMLYESGCKGGTVFRDGCRSEQVLVKEKTKSVYQVETSGNVDSHSASAPSTYLPPVSTPNLPHANPTSIDPAPRILSQENAGRDKRSGRTPPKTRHSLTHKFRVGATTGFMTVGLFDDGTPCEIFLRVSKIGSAISGLLDAWAINFSVALQEGTHLSSLCKHHIGTQFDPCGMTDNSDVPTASSIPDYVCRWLAHRFLRSEHGNGNGAKQGGISFRSVDGVTLPEEPHVGSDSGVYCPDCGAQAVYQAGCLVCIKPGCGWTRCG